MRIKTLKRNTSNVIRKGMEARQAKASQINLNLNVLIRQQKDVEREVHERQATGEAPAGKAAEATAEESEASAVAAADVLAYPRGALRGGHCAHIHARGKARPLWLP